MLGVIIICSNPSQKWKFYKTGVFIFYALKFCFKPGDDPACAGLQINFKKAIMLLKPKVKPTLAEYKPKYTEFSGSIFYLLIPNQHYRDVRQKLSKPFTWQICEELYDIKLYLYII